jgi:hypothetical protein
VLFGGGVAISVGGVLVTGAAAVAILGLVALLAHRGAPIPVQIAAGLPIFGAICLIPVLPVILGGIAVGVGYLVALAVADGHLDSPAVYLLVVGVACATYGLMAAGVAGLIGRIRLRRAGFTPADRSRS